MLNPESWFLRSFPGGAGTVELRKGMIAMNTTDRERGTLLRNTSWQVYSALRLCPENDHVRMTFDRGFPREHMEDLLLKRSTCDETTLIREFQKWCQK